ncbi:MAG: hypothetical protein RIF41_09335 [Polyangiaceae bacterium]
MKKLLFTISAYGYLETAFLATGEFDRGQLHQKPFPDGEIYRRVVDDA